MPAPPSATRLREALAAHEVVDHPALQGRRNHRRAGVLVPIHWRPDPVVLLTRRPATLRMHAGEICFPGGNPEPEDAGDLWNTAIREAREELDLRVDTRLGELCSMPVYTSDYRLVPFVASTSDLPLRPDPDEVAEVVELSLRALIERPLTGVAYDWQGAEYVSPVFEVATGGLVFGATAHTLWELVQLAARAVGHEPPPLTAGPWQFEDLVGDLPDSL